MPLTEQQADVLSIIVDVNCIRSEKLVEIFPKTVSTAVFQNDLMKGLPMKQCIIFLCIFVLTACSTTPSEALIQTAIYETQLAAPTPTSTQKPPPTQEPTPTPTPTPVPLSDLFLEDLLLVHGDLSPEYIGQEIRSSFPPKFSNLPKADAVIHQRFKRGVYGSDGIMIVLYENKEDLENSYRMVVEIISRNADTTQFVNVGEKAMVAESSYIIGPTKGVHLVFTRCHALVHIGLFSQGANENEATNYGARIDKRLSSLVCR
jgi:hypothetical protein